MKSEHTQLIAIGFLFFLFPNLFAQYTLTDADVVVTDGIIQSCSYDFGDQHIIIPNELDGQTVIGIADKEAGNGVFQNKGIEIVEFPDALEYIGDYAFYGNPMVQGIQLDSIPLISIGAYAFYNENGGSEVVIHNPSLEWIGDHAFYGNGLHIDQCDALDSIGAYISSGGYVSSCPNLRYIGNLAFPNSGGADGISSCPSLEFIGDSAFYDEYGIHSDDIDLRGFPKLVHIGFRAFYFEHARDYSIILPEPNMDGYNYRWNTVYAGGQSVSPNGGYSATLEPTYDLKFQIEYGANPIENAHIMLEYLGGGNLYAPLYGSTDISGEVIFTDLLGDVMPYTVQAYNFEDYVGSVTVSDADVTETVMLTPIPHAVNFTVYDGTNPIQLATITLSGYDPITTDAEGKATIADVSPAEDIACTIEADGYNTYSGTVTVYDFDVDVDVTMEITRYTVTFSITDGENPVEGAVVTLSSTAKATDVSGIVEFPEVAPEEGIAYTVIANNYDSYAGTVSVVDQDVDVDVVLTSPVGISTQEMMGFKVYPNPVTDVLSIRIDNESLIGNSSIRLYNQLGEIVYQTELDQQRKELNLSDRIITGIYYMQIVDQSGKAIFGQKVVFK